MKQKRINWKSYGKIIVFIDAANVVYSLRDLGWKIDYKLLQDYFRAKVNLVDIYFYSAYFEDDLGRKNLLEMLSRKGFKVHAKAVKHIKTKDGSLLHKANCDVELTMDAMLLYKTFDTAVLMSGDSDFVPLINFLRSNGRKVIAISTRGHIAKEVIENTDLFFHFGLFKGDWELAQKSKSPALRDS